eukprot:s741_g14.t1
MQTIAWGSMEKYVQLWSCPGASSKAGHLPDLLTIFPIVRHYLHTIIMPAGSCPKACEAFLAHADLLDQVHQGTMYGATTRASLLPAAEFAIQSFQEADFGVPLMKKWHWLLHLPDFLQSHGTLPSTFTTERKHKTIGKLATNLQKTTAFESHLMQQVVAMEIITLKEPGGTIHAHDVVVFHHQDRRWEVGQVWFHWELGARKVTLLQRWTPTVDAASHAAKCTITNEQGFVPIDSIQYPLLYSKASDQEATVLIPYQLYSRL